MVNIYLRTRLFLFVFMSVCFTLAYGQGTVTGTVFSKDKEPIEGATAKIKGTTLGAVTDTAGKFVILNVPAGAQIVQVSYIGYIAYEKAVDVAEGVTTVPDVIMKDDAVGLNDVVVVGYGTQIKKDVSSSLSEIKSDVIGDKPVYDFTSALQGQAAGVQITTDNGLAGAATTVRIRGTKSLSNSAEPLYVVDGVPIVSYDISNADATSGYNISPISNIDPADIESVVILKDAAATAIYGSRGSNGVVIVTTKHGKAGKPKVDISYNGGITQAAHVISLLNGPQFEQLYYQGYRNDSAASPNPSAYPHFQSYPNGITNATAANTNWLKQVLGTGHYQDINTSVSGGDARTTYYIGMGFRDDNSFMMGNKFQRASFRANLDHEVNKYFSIGFNSSLTYTYNKYVPTSAVGGLGAAESTMLPIYPVDSANGHYFLPTQNPVAQINLDKFVNNTYRTISDAYFNVNPIPGLTFRNEFGIDMINQLESFYIPGELTSNDTAVATDRRDFYMTWNLNTTLDYKKDINSNNSIDAIVGFNPNGTKESFSYLQTTNFPSSSYTQPQGGATINAATAGTGRQYNFVSYFARINYTIFQRFLLQASFRVDGSSRFSPGNQYGYFPAGSFGYILSEEKFMKKQHALTFFKARISAGETGNSELTNDFAYLSAYTVAQNYAGNAGIGPANIATPGLTWETTLKTDLGFDFGFLNNRLSGTLDLYYENTKNVLVQTAPLTPSSGFTSTTANIGALFNRGIELQLNSNNLGPKSKLQWKTTLNIATNQNRVTNLGGVQEVTGTNYGNNVAEVGQPIGVWKLAEYAGIDPQTGQTLIYDSTGKNKVVATAANSVEYAKAVGRPYPAFQGGLTNTFSFFNFDLTVLLTFSYGNQIYDDDGKRQTGDMAFGWNQLTVAENAWTTPGQVTNVPKLSLVQNYDINTTRYLYDASYLRLKTLTLGYSLPSKVVTRMKMRSLRIYVSVQNLAVATKYPGWDPETNRDNSGAITQGVSYLNTPQARVYSFGINFGF